MENKKQIILTFVLGLLTALLLLEAGLRIEGSFERVPLSARQKHDNASVILCLGNSYTRGIGAGAKESYPEQLQKLFDNENGINNVKVINAGRSSQNSGELLESLDYIIQKTCPDLIILQTGQPNFWNKNKYGRYLLKSGESSLFKKFIFSSSDILYNSSVYRLSLLLGSKIKERLRCAIADNYNNPDLRSDGLNKVRAWVKQLEENHAKGLSLPIDPQKTEQARNFLERKASSNRLYSNHFYRTIGQIFFFQGKNKEAAEWFIKSIKSTLDMDYNGSRNYLRYVYNSSGEEGIGKLFKRSAADLFGPDYEFSREYLTRIHSTSNDKDVRDLIDSFEDEFDGYWRILPDKRSFFSNYKIYEWLDSDFYEIVGIIKGKKIKLILQNFPPTENMAPGREANLLNSIYLPGIAEKFGLPFIDNNRIFQNLFQDNKVDELLAKDGHCNARGYSVMALNIYNKIREEKLIDPGQ